MAPTKPRNYVTDQQAAFLRGPDDTEKLPILSEEALVALEALFAPRCLSRVETAEEHLRYAGKVELVEMLRNRHTQWADDTKALGDEDYVGGADKASASQQ
ncbi:hypothetical protein [Mesorhizobium sp. WSM4982]|uniref:hypothetical protein n=1 Tax=Mesorhizobium sp. WSM4982 TaxID=3038550 RepID=UPI0024156FB2|nr:hypothetical protein [Mesorhizobium sp. WSM4982]MDG4856421.1 hypothetical protein [Mesorhizobium sp. WSM4982]